MIRTAKICPSCGEGKDLSEYHRDCTRRDGVTIYCKQCRNAAQLKYHHEHKEAQIKRVRDWSKTENGIKSHLERNQRYIEKYPEKFKAQKFIRYCITKGVMKPAKECVCSKCGWETRTMAEHYHHHKGYKPINYLDVIPLCASCHRAVHQNDKQEL